MTIWGGRGHPRRAGPVDFALSILAVNEFDNSMGVPLLLNRYPLAKQGPQSFFQAKNGDR